MVVSTTAELACCICTMILSAISSASACCSGTKRSNESRMYIWPHLDPNLSGSHSQMSVHLLGAFTKSMDELVCDRKIESKYNAVMAISYFRE